MNNQQLKELTFNPLQYIQTYYARSFRGQQEWGGVDYYKILGEMISSVPQFQTCLQIGCGPILINAAFLAPRAQSIILSDYNPDCLKIIAKWMNGDLDFDWNIHFRQVSFVTNKTESEIAESIRTKIISLIQCDLTKKQIFNVPLNKVDLIITTFTYNCATTKMQQFRSMIKNTKNYLKKGGHFILVGSLDSSFYKVSGRSIPCLAVSQNVMRQTLSENNFNIINMKCLYMNFPDYEDSNYSGIYFICARLN